MEDTQLKKMIKLTNRRMIIIAGTIGSNSKKFIKTKAMLTMLIELRKEAREFNQ